ncbi:hypothetical protein V6N11_077112 [Hibiscus sabdariffa]|uniref:DUF659 domain-containing protein n=1 Tax=Hibiscus sabdariffa TaxID=183260 RepID=A0ABR2TCJ0_9ROSI
MLKLLEEWEKKKKQIEFREVLLPCQSQTGIATESSSRKRKSKFSPIATSFNMNVRTQLDEEIARMFYTGSLPFNLARNPHYQRTFTFVATHDIAGYVPLTYVSQGCKLFSKVKDKFFIANLKKKLIDEVGHQNVVQIIIDNASNLKGAREINESMHPHIYWTPCVVYTLNLALKNICSTKNIEGNEETYALCNWTIEIHGDVVQINNFYHEP